MSEGLAEGVLELSTPLRVVFGENGQKLAVGKGNICLIMTNDHRINIPYVYYVPISVKHFLSLGQATNNGLPIELTKNCATKPIP